MTTMTHITFSDFLGGKRPSGKYRARNYES